MPDGGCFCGKVRISYTGEPALKALCHCLDCRKITGSTYSTNLAIPEDNFKLNSGTPKTISKTADTGKTITSHFCGDCGTTLWRDTETMAGLKVVKAGTMDDPKSLGDTQPGVELFVPERVSWVNGIEGAEQRNSMS
ncbi:hypothetical protein K402DRAFT_263143 [Aulographum hederae CBS 113979]|uniref:CENP-V/GFA domain-containing protein n=1 Tax=Aulographum hederae CBS 113979 TaxID=1176131 RepID=A0A6G1H957_9PEZI|nr:hypothetical protein K402DRAFT_263143 [Aulographum hederae CBS 113979]